jgi:uncharacterized membrane protein YqhA
MNRLLVSARYLINLAVLSALAGSAVILIYGVIVLFHIIIRVFEAREFTVEASKVVSLGFIELIDLLFLGVVLYIIALGLYHLFIDGSLRLPRWLKVEDFEELKIILVSVVIVILAINFTGVVVDWDGNAAILNLGLAIGAVVAGLGLIFYVRKIPHPHQAELNESSQSEHSYHDRP